MSSRQINLPDGQHTMLIYESEHSVSFTVYHNVSFHTKQDLRLDKRKVPNWAELIGIAEDLARKRYAPDLFQQRRRGR